MKNFTPMWFLEMKNENTHQWDGLENINESDVRFNNSENYIEIRLDILKTSDINGSMLRLTRDVLKSSLLPVLDVRDINKVDQQRIVIEKWEKKDEKLIVAQGRENVLFQLK